MNRKLTRAQALKTLAAGTAGLSLFSACGSETQSSTADATESMHPSSLKGNINHAVCRWCYNQIELDALCQVGAEMGLKGIDLLSPDEWSVAHKHGLAVSISNGSSLGIPKGFNDPANHAQLQAELSEIIPKAADQGVKNIICFSGNRASISDEQGLENCAIGLEPLAKLAQQHGVYLVMELLNSKVDHPDYQCDKTPWGVALVEKVGSEHFRLLYDIYHMQIMEGDVIATIRKYHPYIIHYHTGGVPGRNEIDETQELYYPAIMRAIVETGYQGFVAQEFIPAGPDPLAALRNGVRICDV